MFLTLSRRSGVLRLEGDGSGGPPRGAEGPGRAGGWLLTLGGPAGERSKLKQQTSSLLALISLLQSQQLHGGDYLPLNDKFCLATNNTVLLYLEGSCKQVPHIQNPRNPHRCKVHGSGIYWTCCGLIHLNCSVPQYSYTIGLGQGEWRKVSKVPLNSISDNLFKLQETRLYHSSNT